MPIKTAIFKQPAALKSLKFNFMDWKNVQKSKKRAGPIKIVQGGSCTKIK